MEIRILKNYGGSLTNERRILPGVYDSEDAALFGLADYLVENGHAIVVIPADGVWADDTTITTQSDTFSGGVPAEALAGEVVPEGISEVPVTGEVPDPDRYIPVSQDEVPREVPEDKPKRGRPKKK